VIRSIEWSARTLLNADHSKSAHAVEAQKKSHQQKEGSVPRAKAFMRDESNLTRCALFAVGNQLQLKLTRSVGRQWEDPVTMLERRWELGTTNHKFVDEHPQVWNLSDMQVWP
jgi:hypothetical protein